MELNEYLGLEARVKGKMTTLNLVSTGDEDVLTPEMNDFNFRRKQLELFKMCRKLKSPKGCVLCDG